MKKRTATATAIASAIIATLLSAAPAEAQTKKYFARARLPAGGFNASGSSAEPTKPTYTGNWYGGGASSESACSGGKRTVTYAPVCGTGDDGEGGYSNVVADSNCDPATKPAPNTQQFNCINCTSALTGPTTSGYGPSSGGATASGGGGSYVQKGQLSQSTARAACERTGLNFGSYAKIGCNLVDRGTYYETIVFATNGNHGSNTLTSGSYLMSCTGN